MSSPTELLQTYFGFSAFRPPQEEIITSIINGRDICALLPTGAGKSLCYQVPALHFYEHGKVTLVISPLVALMKDQVDRLTQRHIAALALNHTTPEDEMETHLQLIGQKKYTCIYVAPERLKDPRFLTTCRTLPIGLIAIDEAHCVSQWGHDFRPDYSHISAFIQQLAHRPVLAAFTATAPPNTLRDIILLLDFQKPRLFQTSFSRENLRWVVESHTSGRTKEQAVLLRISTGGVPAIIYCSTRLQTEYLAGYLQQYHVACLAYHGGMDAQERTRVQEAFSQQQINVIVATNAFGMGVDIPNIRTVIHFNLPGSIEAYYQEAGRAGRDGLPATCLLLAHPEDIKTQSYFLKQAPKKRQRVLIHQLEALVKYAQTSGCRNAALVSFLGQKKGPSHCTHCDNCCHSLKRQRPVEDQAYAHKLHCIWQRVRQAQQKPYAFPWQNTHLFVCWCTLKPQTKEEYLRLPGIGWGWIDRFYAFFAVELVDNVLHT